MDFGVLIDNTIKRLTCLHEIMSRNSIEELILNKMAYVLQAIVFIPLTLYIRDKQNKKGKDRARYSWVIKKTLIFAKDRSNYDGIHDDK